MNQDEIQQNIDVLQEKKARLTSPKNKKKRYKINKKIRALQRELQQCIYAFPNNQFELTAQEYHDYFSHIEDFEASYDTAVRIPGTTTFLPPDRNELFAGTPLIAKCMPALLIPLPFIQQLGYQRIEMIWESPNNIWNRFSSVDGYEIIQVYYDSGTGRKATFSRFSDIRVVFATAAEAQNQFENSTFMNKFTELSSTGPARIKLDIFGNDKIAYKIYEPLPSTIIIWCEKSVIIKIMVVRMPICDLKEMVDIANVKAQLWKVSETTVARLLELSHYQELVVGLRVDIGGDPTSGKKTYIQMQNEFHELTEKKIAESTNGILNENEFYELALKKQEAKKKMYQLRHRCQFCSKLAHQPCKCKKVYYCSPECQTKDWKRHKRECREIRSKKN